MVTIISQTKLHKKIQMLTPHCSSRALKLTTLILLARKRERVMYASVEATGFSPEIWHCLAV